MTATKTKNTKKTTARTQPQRTAKKPIKLSEAEQDAYKELARQILGCVLFAAVGGREAIGVDVFGFVADRFCGLRETLNDDTTPIANATIDDLVSWLGVLRREMFATYLKSRFINDDGCVY